VDTSLLIKRAIVWGASFGMGLVLALGVVFILMETDLETYSYLYFVLTWIPLSMIFVIWGDALLGTKILPD